jgi:4-alpha-glucanotransferase
LRTRASGILLHPTSLPGPHGSGDLGPEAHSFIDFLARASQRWWQMLPVAPPGYGESPYSAQSAFAGSPMLVSPELLAADGLVDAAVETRSHMPASERVDFAGAGARRAALLQAAFAAFRPDDAFDRFCVEEAWWLDDFALFRALKQAHGGLQWTLWDADVRMRRPRAIAAAKSELAERIAFEKFVQFAFDRQFGQLRAYAHGRGVGLVGDVPIFVAHDSADVWQNPDLFFLDEKGEPTVVAGVPPDYFSATGQRWGNPLYRWGRMQRTGYDWWIRRFRATLRRFDAVRLDHFIGFKRSWQIPASEPTAVRGRWAKGPGSDLFDVVKASLGELPLIAEDLGVVTRSVHALRDAYRLPGIKVLQFAFGDDPSADSFLPHNYRRRSVVYTGTHDNDTSLGWFRDPGGAGRPRTPAQAQEERDRALLYLGSDGTEIHWSMIRTALASVARLAILPLQDVLGLGSEARMNRPGQSQGNWGWRFGRKALTPELENRLGMLTHSFGRARRTA